MTVSKVSAVPAVLDRSACPLEGTSGDFDPLLEMIGDAGFVLLGEASQGTHDFYSVRAEITKRLIREKGFNAVAVEADWPDAYRVNRYVRGAGEDADSVLALSGFKRFPQWRWRNAAVLDFVGWLRSHNDSLNFARAGFYGLDLYSLRASMAEVLRYLERTDPQAARRAAERYACFDHFGEDTQAHGDGARHGLAPPCEDAVVEQLLDFQFSAGPYAKQDGRTAADEVFFAEQNARLVANAEPYYRAMFSDRVESWNLRDQHMADTLEALAGHLSAWGPPAKVVVWAHNAHLGDARATRMGEEGEENLGQLVRQRHGRRAVLVGFTTFEGTVTAASDWGAPAERKPVRPAVRGSYEKLFHDVGIGNFFLNLRDDQALSDVLAVPRLERAIGVIYRPDTERTSHYFEARLSAQFDAVLHYDVTRAVEPLERAGPWERGEASETVPSTL